MYIKNIYNPRTRCNKTYHIFLFAETESLFLPAMLVIKNAVFVSTPFKIAISKIAQVNFATI